MSARCRPSSPTLSSLFLAAALLGVSFGAAVFAVPVVPAVAQDAYREMITTAYADHAQAVEAMEALVARVHVLYAEDAVFLQAFDRSQQAWERYRDAQLEALYPGDPSQWGSIRGFCVSQAALQMMQARIAQIGLWVTGVEEGEVCAGSIRRAEPEDALAPEPQAVQQELLDAAGKVLD